MSGVCFMTLHIALKYNTLVITYAFTSILGRLRLHRKPETNQHCLHLPVLSVVLWEQCYIVMKIYPLVPGLNHQTMMTMCVMSFTINIFVLETTKQRINTNMYEIQEGRNCQEGSNLRSLMVFSPLDSHVLNFKAAIVSNFP